MKSSGNFFFFFFLQNIKRLCSSFSVFASVTKGFFFFLLPHDGQEEAPAVEGGRCVFTGEEKIKQTSRPLVARGLRGGAGEMVGIHSIWTNSAIW